jgi:hypothetical protein
MLYQAMLGCRDRARADLCRGKDLAEGRLVSLMPDYKPVESELSAIYPLGKPVSQGAEPDRLSRRALWARAALG